MTAIWSAPTIRRSATLDERGCQVSGRHGSRSEVEVDDDEENCCLDMVWFVYLLFFAECVGSNPSPAKKSEIFHVSRRIVSERSTDRHAACSVSECSTDRSALRSRQIIHDFDYCHVVLPTLTHSYRRQWTISNGPWPMDMADYSLLPPPSPPLPTTCVPLLTAMTNWVYSRFITPRDIYYLWRSKWIWWERAAALQPMKEANLEIEREIGQNWHELSRASAVIDGASASNDGEIGGYTCATTVNEIKKPAENFSTRTAGVRIKQWIHYQQTEKPKPFLLFMLIKNWNPHFKNLLNATTQ